MGNLPLMSCWTHEAIGLFICQVVAVLIFLSVTCWQSVPETYLIYVTWKCHQEDRHSLFSFRLCTVVGEDVFWSLAWAARLKSAGKPLLPKQRFLTKHFFIEVILGHKMKLITRPSFLLACFSHEDYEHEWSAVRLYYRYKFYPSLVENVTLFRDLWFYNLFFQVI